ncbi:hypothetical protein M5215_004399 [Vibrio vulnificus]|nr:hypothetical protein [Vibrio vulnificus]EKA7343472.1 hypothetical protein [Vibrio vulnificus]EKD9327954.1 hypothetical protein [Vibrio vulnificus]ELQ2342528.1 hypothetical protein [Vibrio vulnificus]MCU8168142.1 hypothetical protein [Vibrio vulnificus]
MNQVYMKELNEFCRKFIVIGNYKPTKQDELLILHRYESLKANVFEALMLHERVNLKVFGENVPLAVLLNEASVKGVEELIEQDALRFVHWTPMVMHMVDQVEGMLPIVVGRHTSDVHCDPEASIKKAFGFMKKRPNILKRKMLIRKVRDLYIDPQKGLEHDASNLIMSSYNSGKLVPLGLDNKKLNIYNLNPNQKQLLSSCASEVLEHKFLIKNNFTAHKTQSFSSLFTDSIGKLSRTEAAVEIFKLENFPDLHNLSLELGNPLNKVAKYRSQKNAVRFRSWLDTTTDSKELAEVTRAYIDSIENAKGFFETKRGRLTKNIAMTAIGAGVGSFLGPVGSAVGGLVGKALEPAADFALDMVDEYFVTELLKGWKPRMFIEDMRELQAKT